MFLSWVFSARACAALLTQRVCLRCAVQDAVAPGVQPVENHNMAVASVFFMAFIFVGSFFALNLFVSFIVDGFYGRVSPFLRLIASQCLVLMCVVLLPAAQGTDSQYDEIQYASVNKMVLCSFCNFLRSHRSIALRYLALM